MCTSAACGGSDMRKNAAAATPTAPPACPPASCMYWGLWWDLEPGLGVRGGPEGRQGGGSGGGLLVLVLMLLRPFRCCARSCSSQDVPPRCQQLLWGLVWLNCGRERPSKLRGGCGGAVHGHLRGGCDGACGGVTGFAWATGRGAWLWRWWSRWGVWWGSAAASARPWSRRTPLEGVFCGCRGGAQAAQTTTGSPRPPVAEHAMPVGPELTAHLVSTFAPPILKFVAMPASWLPVSCF